MYIYNVTINIDESVHDEWLQWMKEVHIPEVMSTGMFLTNRILEVLADDPHGVTYSVQYEVKDMDTLDLYREVYAHKLQQQHIDKFKDKFVAFRTVLRVEHDHEP